MLAVIHTIPTAQRQGSQTLICLPARNESVWWVSDLWVTEHTLQIQFNPWLLVLWRTWENVLLKFNTRSFLLPPMQGQRYAYMTPSMACADGGGSGKSNQGRKGRDKTTEKNKDNFMHESLPHLQVLLNTNPISPWRRYREHQLNWVCVFYHVIYHFYNNLYSSLLLSSLSSTRT